MAYRPDYVVEYQRQFLSLKIEFNSLPKYAEKCDLWLERYRVWNEAYPDSKGIKLTSLNILGLAMIHPDFCYDRFGEDFRIPFLDVNRTMSVDEEERSGLCQIKQISDEECAFNEYPEERGRLVGDHLWPFSLGGPSNDKDHWHMNRLLLCSICNNAKSSSVATYNFSKPINWLHTRLHHISIKKESNLKI